MRAAARLFLSWLAVAFLAGTVCAAFPGRAAFAAQGDLAIVTAIDSSGSMKKTDPQNLRLEALRLLLSLLAPDSQVGLLAFDTQPQTLHPIGPLAANRDALLAAVDRIGSDGLHTDLEQALRQAWGLLKESAAPERVVLFLTDGRMDLGDPARDGDATGLLMGEVVPGMAREGIRVYTVAFSEASDVQLLREVALLSRGFFQLARKAEDVHLAFLDLFSQTASPAALPIQASRFYLDRSVSEVSVVVTKQEPGRDVQLTLPDKTRHNWQRHDPSLKWYRAQAFEMITSPNPMVGNWQVDFGAENGNRAFVVTDLRLFVSLDRDVILPQEETRIEAWLEQGEKKEPRQALAIREVQVVAEVVCPTGERSSVPLPEQDAAGQAGGAPGVYAGVLKPCGVGQHEIIVRCKAMTFEREVKLHFDALEEDRLKTVLSLRPPEAEPTPAPPPETPAPAPPPEEKAAEPGWPWVLWRLAVINGVLAALLGGWLGFGRIRRRS